MNIDRYTNPKIGAIRIIRVIIAGTIAVLAGPLTIALSAWSRWATPLVWLLLIYLCGYLAAGGTGSDAKTRMGNIGVGNAWAVGLYILSLWITFGSSSK